MATTTIMYNGQGLHIKSVHIGEAKPWDGKFVKQQHSVTVTDGGVKLPHSTTIAIPANSIRASCVRLSTISFPTAIATRIALTFSNLLTSSATPSPLVQSVSVADRLTMAASVPTRISRPSASIPSTSQTICRNATTFSLSGFCVVQYHCTTTHHKPNSKDYGKFL